MSQYEKRQPDPEENPLRRRNRKPKHAAKTIQTGKSDVRAEKDRLEIYTERGKGERKKSKHYQFVKWLVEAAEMELPSTWGNQTKKKKKAETIPSKNTMIVRTSFLLGRAKGIQI